MVYQYKQPHKKSKKKFVVIALIVLAVVLLIAGGLFIKQRMDSKNTTPQRDDAAQTESAKNDIIEGNAQGSDKDVSSQPNNDTPVTPPSGQTSISIANFSQQNSMVNISANITNVTSGGSCIFNFSHENTRPVIRQVSSDGKTCSSSIPEVEFSIVGIWQLNISFYQGDTKVTETKQNVTIN